MNNYWYQIRQRAFISHIPGGSSHYEPPAPSCHGKWVPTSSINMTLIPNYCHPPEKKWQPWSHLTVWKGIGHFTHQSWAGNCLRGSLIRAKQERWAAESSHQLYLLRLISLKSPNKTPRHCRPRWIISREMSICFKIRSLNELTITANLKSAHTQIRALNVWLLHFKQPGDFEAGKIIISIFSSVQANLKGRVNATWYQWESSH